MKRKEIFLETRFRERITLSRKREAGPVRSECERCSGEVEWLPVLNLLRAFDLSPDDLIDAVENSRLHIRLDQQGILYICERSATAWFRPIETEINMKRKEA